MCSTRFGFQLVFCLTLQIDVCDEDLLIVLKYCCKSCNFFPSLSTPNASHFHMRGGMAEAAVNKNDLLFFHPKCITLLSICTFVKYLYIFPVGFLYLRRISAPWSWQNMMLTKQHYVIVFFYPRSAVTFLAAVQVTRAEISCGLTGKTTTRGQLCVIWYNSVMWLVFSI